MLSAPQNNAEIGTLTIVDANGIQSLAHSFSIVKEQLNYEMRGVLNTANLLRTNLGSLANFYIKLVRNLGDDTFSVEVSRLRTSVLIGTNNNGPSLSRKGFPVIAYNLDNKYYGDSYNGDEIYSPDESAPFRIHRSLIGETPITQVSSLTIGLRESIDNKKPEVGVAENLQANFEIGNFSFFPHFFPVRKTINVTENSGVIYQMVKEITITPRITISHGQEVRPLRNNDFEIGIKYCNFLIVPAPINTLTFNHNVAAIYLQNDSEQSPLHDYQWDLHESSMRSSAFTGKMNLTIDEKRAENFQIKITHGNGPDFTTNRNITHVLYAGDINLLDSSYFDYDKRQTHVGYAANAEIGEIIPYNFLGEYARDVDFSVARSLQNLHLHVHKSIEIPVLNRYFGQVKLKVTNASEPFPSRTHVINAQALRRLREEIKANNPISLVGLENFS